MFCYGFWTLGILKNIEKSQISLEKVIFWLFFYRKKFSKKYYYFFRIFQGSRLDLNFFTAETIFVSVVDTILKIRARLTLKI